MAAIFPPADKGGVPPGPNVCDGYTPANVVIGEGPLYVSADCTTVLTDCQLNALTSELLAAVDRLGFAYNSSRITNLGDALVDVLNHKVDRSGDTMLGPLLLARDPVEPMEAVTKQYCDNADQSLALNKVARAGDTMTGPLVLHGNPAGPLEAVPRQFVDAIALQVDGKVERSGDTMTGPLTLAADPTAPMQAVTLQYADANFLTDAPHDGVTYGRANGEWVEAGGGSGGGSFLPLSGGTLTGPLTLYGAPTLDLHAATKLYVDQTATNAATTAASGRVSRAGDTMTGALVLSGAPTLDLHAATKLYVDTGDAARVAKAGDTMTGNLRITSPHSQVAVNTTGSTSAHAAQVNFERNGLIRWVIRGAIGVQETGNNAGSNLEFLRCNDAGTSLDTPLWLDRARGNTRCFRMGVGNDGVNDSNLGNVANISTTVGLFTTYGIIIRSLISTQAMAQAFQFSDGSIVGSISIGSTATAFNTTSDARLKSDARPFNNGRAIVDALAVQAFTWASSGADDIGVMAQDAQQVYPPAVTPGHGEPGTDDFRPWAVDYSKYVPVMLQTLQDAFRKIDDLAARVTALEAAAARGA